MRAVRLCILLSALLSLLGAVGASAAVPLTKLHDVPLPGGTTRFDYQSLDPTTGILYINHMGDNRVVMFDTRAQEVVAAFPRFALNTGILVVPEIDRLYVSEAAVDHLAVVDTNTHRVLARLGTGAFPDGIAYDSKRGRVFVSDERGGSLTVVDARQNRPLGRIPMRGEVGNVRYDATADQVYVPVQTQGELAIVDPGALRVLSRHPLPRCSSPHGLRIARRARLAFVACAGNARLQVVDLASFKVRQSIKVGEDPDVIAFDNRSGRLYVAAESGVLTVLRLRDDRLVTLGRGFIDNSAHSVAVDPATGYVYLPLEDVGGQPVLRVMSPE